MTSIVFEAELVNPVEFTEGSFGKKDLYDQGPEYGWGLHEEVVSEEEKDNSSVSSSSYCSSVDIKNMLNRSQSCRSHLKSPRKRSQLSRELALDRRAKSEENIESLLTQGREFGGSRNDKVVYFDSQLTLRSVDGKEATEPDLEFRNCLHCGTVFAPHPESALKYGESERGYCSGECFLTRMAFIVKSGRHRSKR